MRRHPTRLLLVLVLLTAGCANVTAPQAITAPQATIATTATATASSGPAVPAASIQPATSAEPVGMPEVVALSARRTVATVLASLKVAPEHRRGYERTKFKTWIDADHDGCDTRKEVLIAEAIVAPHRRAGCFLSGGTWRSLYDRLSFTNSSNLDIDHVVPLAEAWDSGAWRWTSARRQAFANDLGRSWVLIAVSAHSNRSKGDRDPAGWMPTSVSYRCRYLATWVAIKARWHLTVDPVEKRAIASFASCRNTAVPR